MSPLAQKILQANRAKYEAAPNPLRSHGPDHHLRVYEYAKVLAAKIGVEYDDDILAGACLLHDLAAYYPEESGENYHNFDDMFANEVLVEVDFPEPKRRAVGYAIAHHGSDAKYKDKSEPIEVTLLRDADKLDVFGPVGAARIMMVRALKGDTLAEIVDDFYTKGHLQRKWDSITYPETRALAQEDYEYSVNFFKRLGESIQPEALS